MNRSSLRTAILIPSLSVLIAGVILMVSIVGVLSARATTNLGDQLLDAKIREYTNAFQSIMQDVHGSLITLKPIIENYIDPDFVADVSDPRGEVTNLLIKVLDSNDAVIGVWTCWEPNAFDGRDAEYANTSFYDASGRFIPFIMDVDGRTVVAPLPDYDDPVEGYFYRDALTTGRENATDPYMDNYDGVQKYIFSLVMPIFKDGAAVGAVGLDVDLHEAIETMNSGGILESGYFFLLSPGGDIVTHPDEELLLTHYTDTWMNNEKSHFDNIMQNGGVEIFEAYSDIINADIKVILSGVSIGETQQNWLICAIVPISDISDATTSIVWSVIAVGTGLILVAGVVIFIVIRRRLRRLPVLTAAAEAITLGEVNITGLDHGTQETRNEITLLERAFFRMTAVVAQQADILGQISLGDYSVSIPVRSDNDVMNRAVNDMLDKTNDTLGRINTAAAQVSLSAKHIADGAQSLASGATEQAATVEQLSASINEIAVKTKGNAEMAIRAADLSRIIRDSADKGSAQMEQMMRAVKDINDASHNISKVIETIDNLAFQTNILALNAAVEAAHAGQHGKGFAVVAEEVRNLAAQSADAAKDTGRLIENSVLMAELGARIAEDTARSLGGIVEGINESAQLVSDIALSSEEQSLAIDQINSGIEQVAQVVQQNSATAEESAAASQEMSSQSDMLADLIAQFKLKDADMRLPEGAAEPRRRLSGGSAASSGESGGFGKY